MTTMNYTPHLRFSEAKQHAIDEFELKYFTRLHDHAQGNISEMARLSGLQRAHVRGYLERHGIGGRAPVGRPVDVARATIARITEIVAPREGETLEDAVARLTVRRRRAPRRKAKGGA